MPTPKTRILQDVTLHQVALKCDNLAASRAFYCDLLGAECIAEFDPPGLLFLRFGETRLLLDRNAPNLGLVYFRIGNIEDKVAQMQALGIALASDIQTVFTDDKGLFGSPGDTEYMVFFKDPSGNTLALAEQHS